MPKFYGEIGYSVNREIEPGVWVEEIVKRNYYGDLVRNVRSLSTSGSVNNDVSLRNEISIVSDPYANENFHCMRYVEFMGSKWRIVSVEAKYPRLILTIGGVYNGD